MAKEMINTALGSRNICGSPESSADVQPEYLSICKRLTKYRSSTNIEEINLNINEYVNVILYFSVRIGIRSRYHQQKSWKENYIFSM